MNFLRLSAIMLTLMSILFAFFFLTTDHKAAFAVEAEGTQKFGIYIEPEERLFEVANMAPGDYVERQIIVKNIGQRGFSYTLSAVLHIGDKLFNVFTISIKNKEGHTLYQGNLRELDDLHLGALETSEEEPLLIEVVFPGQYGNEYQGESIYASLLFKAMDQRDDEGDDDFDSHGNGGNGGNGEGGTPPTEETEEVIVPDEEDVLAPIETENPQMPNTGIPSRLPYYLFGSMAVLSGLLLGFKKL